MTEVQLKGFNDVDSSLLKVSKRNIMAQFYMHKIFNMFGVFLISETKVTILVELKGHITDKCNLYKL
jgi:hypothetical protein